MRTVSREYLFSKMTKDCNDTACVMVHMNDKEIVTISANGNDYDLTMWGVVVAHIGGEKMKSDGPIFRSVYQNMRNRLGK